MIIETIETITDNAKKLRNLLIFIALIICF